MKLNNSAIETLQQEIFEKQKELKALRLAQPLEEIKEYTFHNKLGEEVSLNSLFQEGDELLVVHNMGKNVAIVLCGQMDLEVIQKCFQIECLGF